MKRLKVCSLTLLISLAACSSSSLPKDSFCRHVAEFQNALQDFSNGTETTTEEVDRLDGLQSDFSDDALLFEGDGNTSMAAAARGLSDTIGRMKVAISNGEAPDMADLSRAIDALPIGFCN